MMKRIAIPLLALFLHGCGNEAAVIDESWVPTADLEVINPWAVGGSADTSTRLLNQYLEKDIDNNIIMSNITGAAGIIGLVEFMNKPSDEHRLFLAGIGLFTFTPLMNSDIDYSFDEFKPVAEISQDEFIIYANPAATGIRSMDDMFAYAEKDLLVYASNPPGGTTYLLETALFKMAGIDNAESLTGNSVENLTALLGGHAQVAAVPATIGAPYVEDGTLIPIGVFSDRAYTGHKGFTVPSIKETYGYDIVFQSVNFLVVDHEVSDHVVNYYHSKISSIYADPQFQQEAMRIGPLPFTGTPEQLRHKVESLSETMTRLVPLVTG